MSFLKIVKNLKYKQLKSVSLLFLRRPLFIFPTFIATMNAYNISDKQYPKIHNKNGKANAFRHALWNILICNECFKWKKNSSKVTAWAQILTDWHEEFSPNKPLDKAMDLHNNAYGRQLFEKLNNLNGKLTNEIIISNLKSDLECSIKITSVLGIDKFMDRLVYINDIV